MGLVRWNGVDAIPLGVLYGAPGLASAGSGGNKRVGASSDSSLIVGGSNDRAQYWYGGGGGGPDDGPEYVGAGLVSGAVIVT